MENEQPLISEVFEFLLYPHTMVYLQDILYRLYYQNTIVPNDVNFLVHNCKNILISAEKFLLTFSKKRLRDDAEFATDCLETDRIDFVGTNSVGDALTNFGFPLPEDFHPNENPAYYSTVAKGVYTGLLIFPFNSILLAMSDPTKFLIKIAQINAQIRNDVFPIYLDDLTDQFQIFLSDRPQRPRPRLNRLNSQIRAELLLLAESQKAPRSVVREELKSEQLVTEMFPNGIAGVLNGPIIRSLAISEHFSCN